MEQERIPIVRFCIIVRPAGRKRSPRTVVSSARGPDLADPWDNKFFIFFFIFFFIQEESEKGTLWGRLLVIIKCGPYEWDRLPTIGIFIIYCIDWMCFVDELIYWPTG